MRDQLKELLNIAESVVSEIRKNRDMERSIIDEGIEIGNTHIYICDFSWCDHKSYAVRFYPTNKTLSSSIIKIEWTDDDGFKVVVKDYFYFTNARINKLVNDNKDLLERLSQAFSKRTDIDKQERIAELEKQIAKLKV
jgi:hypothetical protein